MTSQIHQISLSYSSEEDRLLLIITTRELEEYRIWLTRRYTSILLGVVRKIIQDFGGLTDQSVSQEVQNLFKDGAFDKPLEQNTGSLPFGNDGILAYGLSTEQIDEMQFAIELFSKEQRKISFGFNKANIVMFHNLLQQCLLKTNWNIVEIVPKGENIH
jgi:hypothetical protein